MNTCTYIDKTDWPRGPWDNEPDVEVFEYKGYKCCLKRNSVGAWCGYVAVPLPSIINNEDVVDQLEVHWGITYNEYLDDTLVLGFDCAHYDDLMPSMVTMLEKSGTMNKMHLISGKEYRTIEYARNELKQLVDQIEKKVKDEDEKKKHKDTLSRE